MLLHFNKVQLQFPGVFTKAVILVKSCFMRPDFDDEGGTKPFAINLHKNAISCKKNLYMEIKRKKKNSVLFFSVFLLRVCVCWCLLC